MSEEIPPDKTQENDSEESQSEESKPDESKSEEINIDLKDILKALDKIKGQSSIIRAPLEIIIIILKIFSQLVLEATIRINFFMLIAVVLYLVPIIFNISDIRAIIMIIIASLITLPSFILTIITNLPSTIENIRKLKINGPPDKNRLYEKIDGKKYPIFCPRCYGFIFGMLAAWLFYWNSSYSLLNKINEIYLSLDVYRFIIIGFILCYVIYIAVLRRYFNLFNSKNGRDVGIIKKAKLFLFGFVNGMLSICYILEIFYTPK